VPGISHHGVPCRAESPASSVAAKQAAFEEQNKIRNQFRALDDDEVDFLEEVRAKKRKEEELVRRETEEGLRAFRDRQKGAGAAEGEGEGEGEGDVKIGVEAEDWGGAGARKRKRAKDREVKGAVIKRRASDGEKVKSTDSETKKQDEAVADEKKMAAPVTQTRPALGLADYGSDDSD
jgi:hypothetical protein